MNPCHCIDAEVLDTCPGCLRTFCVEHDRDDINDLACDVAAVICARCIEGHESKCWKCRKAAAA